MSIPMSTAVNMYGFYRIPESYRDKEVPTLLLKGQVYEPRTIRLIRDWARRGSVISGGAFVGDFLPAISTALAQGQRLISFEPNPVSHAAALETIALNRLANVSLAGIAVGAAEGILNLQVARDDGPMAAQARIIDSALPGKTLQVPVRTIDSLVGRDETIAVLHLDLEGHEPAALQGARQTVSRHKPLIIVEGVKPHRVRAYLEVLGQIAGEAGYFHAGSMERNSFYLPAPVLATA